MEVVRTGKGEPNCGREEGGEGAEREGKGGGEEEEEGRREEGRKGSRERGGEQEEEEGDEEEEGGRLFKLQNLKIQIHNTHIGGSAHC